jgi:ribosome-binding protein aMBF1 (putative translation factor)
MAKCKNCGSESTHIVTRYIKGELMDQCDQCARLAKTFYEFIPDNVKEDRVKHFKTQTQPFREGQPSREFIEAYPEKAEKVFSKEQRENAKYVWRDLKGWETRHKSL